MNERLSQEANEGDKLFTVPSDIQTRQMMNEDGEMVDVQVLELTIPEPYAPEMNETMKGTLDLVKLSIDKKVESVAIVPVPTEVAERMARLYDFHKVEPAIYNGMAVWATDMLPEGGLFVIYSDRAYIVSLPHIVYSVEEGGEVAPWPTYPDGWYRLWKPEDGEGSMNEFVTPVVGERVANGGGVRVVDFFLPPSPTGWAIERVYVLTERQREAVLRHVGVTLDSINDYGETGIPPEFIADLRAIKEALG